MPIQVSSDQLIRTAGQRPALTPAAGARPSTPAGPRAAARLRISQAALSAAVRELRTSRRARPRA